MRFWLFFFPVCLAAAGIIGCDRNPTPAQAPATQPAPEVIAPASEPTLVASVPATQPADSSLLIDQAQEWFPQAMLRLTTSDGKIVARLYSDDPSGVLSGKETVNSYDFEMTLPDISDPANIEKAVWTSKSPSNDRQDTPYGIFLNNQQKVLQPMDVTAHFVGTPPHVQVELEGKFWMFKTGTEANPPPPVMVTVVGSLAATVPAK